ncbi:MAG: hypothetical protein B7X98_00555 [Methylophilaceae bacterium 17-43-7]|jgi:uncharacterized protein YjbJ (UPF0337 family)|nr:MAG: hypothetical protein B7Y48_03445 [Methylophilales bacterium 28-44-11]OYZ70689.1 MAG: hypothetical protein B7X98_00555 [Methylophilaceae bacterium 17-43-7]
MHWESIETNWEEFKGKFKQNWNQVSDEQLEMAQGKRDRLARIIQRTYAINQREAEAQLSDWQNAHINIDGHFYTSPAHYKSI